MELSWAEPLWRHHTEGRLLALPTNTRVGWKCLMMTRTLAYYNKILITAVKCFVWQARFLFFHEWPTLTVTFNFFFFFFFFFFKNLILHFGDPKIGHQDILANSLEHIKTGSNYGIPAIITTSFNMNVTLWQYL
jgi:hypothetical protein